MKLRLRNAMAYMPFAYYYIGPVAFITYLMAYRSLIGRLSSYGLFYCLSFMLYTFWLFSGNGVENGLYVIRFYWGFLLFYLVFRSGIQIQTDKILVFLSVLTILEAVLVNTIIPAELLPNYPSIIDAAGHYAQAGEYQRPYSFGGSTSVTSVILVALLTISKLGLKQKLLVIAAVLACMSGSGLVALFIYLFATMPTIAKWLLFSVFAGVAYSELVYKISIGYISHLIEFKQAQIEDEVPDDSLISLLFGAPFGGNMGGDFAGLSFFVLNGFAGLIFLLAIVFLNLNKRNWLPILVMLVGTVHYGVIFFLPGQLMFGYLLAMKPNEISSSAQNNNNGMLAHKRRQKNLAGVGNG